MLQRLRREDDGFTLVEALAAMIVFAILAVSVMNVILNGFQLSKSNKARVTAANLAAQHIEATRAMEPTAVPDGLTVTSPPPIDGVQFEVRRTANYVASDSGTSLCTGSASASGVRLAYKLVTVNVTWPSMGSVQPVRQDTLLNLGIDALDPTRGTAAVGVTGPGGLPTPGVTVTLQPGSLVRTTGADGCAVFTGLQPGTSFTAVLGQNPFVSRSSALSVTSTPFTVTAGGVTRVPLQYSPAGAASLTLSGPSGLVPPTGLGATFTSADLSPTDRPFLPCTSSSAYHCLSGTPPTAARLWPGTYGVRPGTCQDGLTATAVPVSVTAGSVASATLPLAGVRVEVRSSPTATYPSGQPLTGYTVYAVHPADSLCLAQSWPMTPAGGSLQGLALPAGQWTFSLTADGTPMTTVSSPWPTRTLSVGAAVETLVIYVNTA